MTPAEFNMVLDHGEQLGYNFRGWAVRIMQVLRPGYHVVEIDSVAFLRFHAEYLVKTSYADEIAKTIGFEPSPAKPRRGRPRKTA